MHTIDKPSREPLSLTNDVATLRDWAIRYGYLPYRLMFDIEAGQLVELISMPWATKPSEDDVDEECVVIFVREPNDPTTLRLVRNPQLVLINPEQVSDA
jgi:hypothetical protein